MGTGGIVGLALISAGALDCVVAVALVGPRSPDARTRQVVVGAMVSGGVLMMLLGGAFMAGVIPLGE